MKKLLVAVMVLFAVILSANSSDLITAFGGTTNISLSRELSNNLNYSEQKVLAIPAEDIEIDINHMEITVYDANGNIVETRNGIDESRLSVVQKFTLREMRGFSIKIDNVIEENSNKAVITSLDFSVNPVGTISYPTEIAEAFAPVYAKMADNWDTCYLRNLPFAQPTLLIMGNEMALAEAAIAEFMKWKRQLGFKVETLTKEDLGSNAAEIKETLQSHCDNNGIPEYMLIIGDVNDTYEFPSFYHSEANNVADLAYTLLDGDDYLPESIIGRFSVDSASKLMTVVAKTILYERSPDMSDTDWMKSALVVAGNYADGPAPVTPVQMSRWIYDELIDIGYTDVDTVFYPGTYPGTNEIGTAINEGRQLVSYRGWGAADGWHYPEFHTEHLEYLTNGQMMPIVTSIVCNTGDFANVHHDPCFGEAFMSLGTPTSPKGAIAFVGPSDLHTSTEKNNAISSGIYWSILHEGNRSFGSAVLRGKTELYDNYPNNRETNGQVEFYYQVYNILCDPTLNMWIKIPSIVDVNVPSSIDQGTNYLQFDVPSSLNGAVITATRDHIEYSRNIIQGGTAFINVDSEETGELTITIAKKNIIPVVETVTINSADAIGITDYSFSNLQAASTATINLTAKNVGSSNESGVTATISTSNPEVTIDNNSISFGDINSGSTANANCEVTLSSNFDQNDIVEFTIEFSTGETSKIYSQVDDIQLAVSAFAPAGDNILNPGDASAVEVTFTNIGQTSSTTSVTVTSLSDAVEITNASFDLSAMNPGQTASGSFEVSVENDVFNGRMATFQFDLEDEEGRTSRTYYTTTIGVVTTSDPTGHDRHGYFAYDSSDSEYSAAPTYEWIECDPDHGGSGTVLIGKDDERWTVDLPFSFKYYGEDYDEITICTNGWISMGETWMTNFRNWDIPAALGPKAQISAYWDDLKGHVDGDNIADVRISYWHDTDNNKLIVQWRDAYNRRNNTSIEQFQVVLEPRSNQNGDITVNYALADNPDAQANYCTVGIENYYQNDGICYTYANHYPDSAMPLQNEMSIKFTMDAPDNYTSNDGENISAADLALGQNYPNPFNPTTKINFNLNKSADVALEIYNVKGQKVRTLINAKLEQGQHNVMWHGKDDKGSEVSSGIYFYKLRSGKLTKSKKMILLK
jgi:hypothetical protein